MTKEKKNTKPGFIQELQRRKVFRVAVAYLIVSWLVIQIADTTFEPLLLPEWSQTLVVALAMIGFPVALVLAWAFDVTPDGVKKTGSASEEEDAEENCEGPSIAVLPFVNMSDSKENEYFSDGLAEELLTMLSRISSLKVCSRSSSFAYKTKDIHVPTVARKLGVATIVEGSVRRAGDKVRVTVQVSDARNDKHLWAKTFDRKLDDIFAVQSEIAEQIVESLHLTLSLEEQKHVTDQTTENFEAYDYYLRGKDQYCRSGTGHLASALRMFDKAIEIDPDYALAYAGRTYCLTDAFLYRRNEEPTLDRAFESSSKAVELADHLAESHTARGLTLMAAEKFPEAKESFERALSINPTLYEPLNFYSRLARLEGDPEKVLELAQRAVAVQPDNYQSWTEVANQLKVLGRDEEAVAAVERAQLVTRKAIDADPANSRAMSFLAIMLGEQGNSDEAKLWIERALVTAPDTGGTHYNAACGYALLGETELALGHLERGIELGAMHKQWYDTDADMDSLRDEPRFIAAMKRV